MDSGDHDQVIRDFNRLYYGGPDGQPLIGTTTWMGVSAQKYPTDAWIYQEILWRTRPAVIVETGVNSGGTTLFLATVCDAMAAGEVIGVDITLERVHPRVRGHPRITLIEGSSTDPAVVSRVHDVCRGRPAMVILDSDHTREHVAAEMEAYAPLVPPGHYLVCEDTNLNGHPVYNHFGPGPWEAVQEFLRTHEGWTVDRSCERLLLTANPGGYLLRVS
jgi:cephalosporin hydroxylase